MLLNASFAEVYPKLSLYPPIKDSANKEESVSVTERVKLQKFHLSLYLRVTKTDISPLFWTFRMNSSAVVTDTSSILPTNSVDFIIYFSFMME